MTAPTVPTAPLPSELPPADYDKAYNRHYLPLPGGWEVQTKGNGSSFRIAGPDDFRLLIPDQPYVHETLERMARDIREAVLTMQRDRDDALAKLSHEEEAHAQLQARCFDGGSQSVFDAVKEAREQLAASERTCAELRASIDRAVTGMNALSVQSAQIVDENAKLRARAEAAERTVEGLRGKP